MRASLLVLAFICLLSAASATSVAFSTTLGVALRTEVQKCDNPCAKTCPTGSTCCQTGKDGALNLCPHKEGSCCEGGLHCCPKGTTCTPRAGSVVPDCKKGPAAKPQVKAPSPAKPQAQAQLKPTAAPAKAAASQKPNTGAGPKNGIYLDNKNTVEEEDKILDKDGKVISIKDKKTTK